MTKPELLEAITAVLAEVESAEDVDALNILGLKALRYVSGGQDVKGIALGLREANELSLTIRRKIALRHAELVAES